MSELTLSYSLADQCFGCTKGPARNEQWEPHTPGARSIAGAPAPKTIHIGTRKRFLAHVLGGAAVVLRKLRRGGRGNGSGCGRSVLIVEPFGLGDVVLHEPMVRALREAGFEVTFCARSEWRPLFPDVSWIDSKLAWGQQAQDQKYTLRSYFNRQFRQFFQELRQAARKATAGIDTRGDIRTVSLLYAAGCRDVIALSSYLGSDLGMSPGAARVVPFSPELRRWQMNLRCLAPLGVVTDGITSPAFPHLRKRSAKRERVIGLLPVAPWPGKWWDPDKWRELVSALREQGWEARGFCGPGQSALACRQLADAAPVVEVGSVLEWAERLQEVAALVALDSGPMHLADALGTPVVALFGQTLFPLWAPSGRGSVVVTHQHEPGFQPGMPTEENTEEGRRWMQRIEVSEVMAALQPLLERPMEAFLDAATADPSL